MNKQAATWKNYLAPRFWSTWLLIGFMRLLGMLPFKFGLKVGKAMGTLLYYLAKERRHIVEVNIRLCFPELTELEKKRLVKKVMQANAIGFVETAWSYWGNFDEIKGRATFKNFELVEKAKKQNRGVLLLGAHFSTLDLGGLLFSLSGQPLDCIYRQHNNPLMDYLIYKKRSRFCQPIERKKLRYILRGMKQNHCIWYAPDQDFGYKGSVFVPFFGQTAATITATTKMAALNNSVVLMLSHHRNKDNTGYTIEVFEIDGFPSGDEKLDAEIINRNFEREIRKAPEQYMWVHRRFKTQPDGRKRLYKKA